MNRKHWLLNSILLSLLASIAAVAIAATGPSLLEMSDLLDGIEKQDFQAAINKANACTRARNFPCAETELAKAAKAANSGQDKKTLLASRNSLANEKQQLANEIRRAEEARQAQIRRQEEREAQREREEQQARAAEDRQSTSDYYAAIGAQILQRGAENAALLNRVDRQTNAALDESNRVRAAAARDRARAEREEREAERRRDAARERASHADAERTARARAAQPAPEPPKYQPRAATLPKADLQINPQSRSTATLAANTGREQPSGAATQARTENVRSNPTPGSGRAVHEVEEDLSAYKGWAVIARGDHMASREASCNDNKAKVARKLSRDKTAAQGLVNQSPCVCTKWWNDDRAVPGMWQCAILGQYTGKGDGGSIEK